MTKYKLIIARDAVKDLRKMDTSVRKLILAYIENRLKECENPRAFGKALTGEHSGKWRYRVGNYRILANINDGAITIFIIKIGHRGDVYSN